MFTTLLLLADADSKMPLPKAILLLVACLAIGFGSLAGVFAPSATLQRYSHVIGTENPLVSRVVCCFGAIVGLMGSAAFAASLAGYI